MVIISLIILVIIWFMWTPKTKKMKKPINLEEPVQLRFIKSRYWDEYHVQFFNPSHNDWWTLPELRAGIHAPWSFEQRGSYGPSNLYTMLVASTGIPYIKTEYKTLGDIEAYMVKLREKYAEFKESERIDRNRPTIIY